MINRIVLFCASRKVEITTVLMTGIILYIISSLQENEEKKLKQSDKIAGENANTVTQIEDELTAYGQNILTTRESISTENKGQVPISYVGAFFNFCKAKVLSAWQVDESLDQIDGQIETIQGAQAQLLSDMAAEKKRLQSELESCQLATSATSLDAGMKKS